MRGWGEKEKPICVQSSLGLELNVLVSQSQAAQHPDANSGFSGIWKNEIFELYGQMVQPHRSLCKRKATKQCVCRWFTNNEIENV